ncbi:proteasome inhibitor PI31 subunit isoform X1 [Dunckerocampus dactyliophorus]|uniref:proteasome inhibitor PI31 subunit isoform X1 n=1 Tax=Dunckerocampus dactyliophorus TaxID=161453 RepID=UPI002405D8C3|nr:proteasome inhibitor PI31 subunit isoform X1 [Dunckerocampus dactyliophorus]
MAGLELLYSCCGGNISCPQDAIVCLVHWEIIKSGYKCVGSGDEPRGSDKKSELLPSDWSSSKVEYTLRYTSEVGDVQLLLKALLVDSALIFNLMNRGTQQGSDLIVNLNEHVDKDHLQTFDRVFKDVGGLTAKVRSQLLPSQDKRTQAQTERSRRTQREDNDDDDPLRVPSRHPRHGAQAHWPDAVAPPFSVGGADLDPLGRSGTGGGMLIDPLRSGYPRSGFDPSSGIPDILPPGAVPPGARFDPFGPIGRHRPGPDPDHMPPPGYDDMFM